MRVFLLLVVFFSSNFAVARESVHVRVSGLVCALCVKSIEKKFEKQPEVKKVEINLDKKYVHLDFHPGKNLTDEKIESILKESNYEVLKDDK